MSANRYPHMVHEYYVERLRQAMAQRAERLNALKTRADAERYVRSVRRAAKKAFAPMPRRTPAQALVIAREEYDDYAIEKIAFQSRPRFFVTGNMYLPHKGPDIKPAVLGLCGHSLDGKAEPAYQAFSQLLARHGFIVFIVDPISQGERRQFYPADGGARPGLCEAHNIMGNQMVLTGDFFGTWRVWDAIRAIDVLLERDDVDRSRVGVTGNSGGGTLTTYVTALDPRIAMAAPSCYICSYLANMENEMPSDAEQNPPGIVKSGLDQVDLLLAYAPRPTMILSQELDFFDVRYARRAADDLRRVHRLLGARHSAEFFAGPTIHGYSQHNREAMLEFFMRHAHIEGQAKEDHLQPAPAKALYAAPRGEVRHLGSRPVFEFTADAARQLAEQRGKPDADTVRRAAARLLGVKRRPRKAPHYRQLPHYCRAGAPLAPRAAFAVETEPGVAAYVAAYGQNTHAMSLPQGPVRLYIGHTSGQADLAEVRAVRDIMGQSPAFLVVDPRGIGQSKAQTCNDRGFFDPYGADYLYAATGEMLGESYLGRRVHDIMRTLDLLEAHGAGPCEVVGRGLGAIVAAFAALLHPSEPRTHLMHYLPSYELLALHPRPQWPLSALLRGVLKEFDLPDVYRALGRRLKKGKPWNAKME